MLPELKICQLDTVPLKIYTPKNPHDAIEENKCDLYAYIWPAGIICAEYIHKHQIHGKVLELGCGNGISGVMALKSGASCVHFTDISKEALELSELNCQINNVSGGTYALLDWFNPPEYNELYDYIIASDCLYLSRTFSKLKEILNKYLKKDGVAIFVDPGRGLIDNFVVKLDEFNVERIDAMNIRTVVGPLKLATTLVIKWNN